MPFKPGISGNPSGRPKNVLHDGRTLNEVAREKTELAIETLAYVASCGGETGSARVAAANALLDRGWGRPSKAIAPCAGFAIGTGRLEMTGDQKIELLNLIFGCEKIEQLLEHATRYIEKS